MRELRTGPLHTRMSFRIGFCAFVLVVMGLAEPSLAYRFSNGRLARGVIRPLSCSDPRTGETGICMFVMNCARAKGTPLSTCRDGIYVGSCCRLPQPTEELSGNDINAPPWNTVTTTPENNGIKFGGGGIGGGGRPSVVTSVVTSVEMEERTPDPLLAGITPSPDGGNPQNDSVLLNEIVGMLNAEGTASPSTRPVLHVVTPPISTHSPIFFGETPVRFTDEPDPNDVTVTTAIHHFTRRPIFSKPSPPMLTWSTTPFDGVHWASNPDFSTNFLPPTSTFSNEVPHFELFASTTRRPPPSFSHTRPTTPSTTQHHTRRPPHRPTKRPVRPQPMLTTEIPSSASWTLTTSSPTTLLETFTTLRSTTIRPTTWRTRPTTTVRPSTRKPPSRYTTKASTTRWTTESTTTATPSRLPPPTTPTSTSSIPYTTTMATSRLPPPKTTVTQASTTTDQGTISPETTTEINLAEADFRDVCGLPFYSGTPSGRIVGGQKAAFGKWPWQVSLRQLKRNVFQHKCGAALLNENWAITAAHCVDNVPVEQLQVRMGEFDVTSTDEPLPHADRQVQIIAKHPNFNPRNFENDLALIRFFEALPFQKNIIPICLPTDDATYINDTAYVTGWGRLYEDGPLPEVLYEAQIPIISNKECEKLYRVAGYIESIPNMFICAGRPEGGIDSCEGDSGGPMVVRRPDKRWVLAGIISWGIGCAEPNQPGVYTRISNYRDWINAILVF